MERVRKAVLLAVARDGREGATEEAAATVEKGKEACAATMAGGTPERGMESVDGAPARDMGDRGATDKAGGMRGGAGASGITVTEK